MGSIKKAVEDAIMELIDDGKLIIKGPDGEEMEDLSIEMKLVEEDDEEDSYGYDDEDDDREEDDSDEETDN